MTTGEHVCAICDQESHAVSCCARCMEEGNASVYCLSCCAQCPSCKETFCEDHANSKTKWCRLCTQREDGPEDVITDDHWQATQ